MMAAARNGAPPPSVNDVAPQLLAQLLEQCGEARIRVAGTSMLPSIRPADVLHIRPVAIASVQRDDVILFASGRRLYIHRVVHADAARGDGVLITRGDMHAHDDPPVTRAHLLGRVAGQERGGMVMSPALAPWRLRPVRRAGLWFACACRMRGCAQTIRSLRLSLLTGRR